MASRRSPSHEAAADNVTMTMIRLIKCGEV